MSTRTAAFVFDNFLSDDKWQYISSYVNQSDFLSTESFAEWRDPFYQKIIGWIDDRAKQIDTWQHH